jgi:hypothetical protein
VAKTIIEATQRSPIPINFIVIQFNPITSGFEHGFAGRVSPD